MATVIKAGNNSTGAQVSSDNTGILTIATGTGAGTTAVTVDASQNVGVGTTSPNEKLVVNGAVRSRSNAVNVTASAGAVMDYFGGLARFFATDGASVGQMNLDIGGNLGIGTTSPTVALDVYRTAYPEIRTRSASYTNTFGVDTVNGFGAIGSVTNNPFVFVTNNTERMRLDANGNFIVGGTAATNTAANRGNITLNGTSTAIISVGTGGAERGYIYTQGTDFIFNATTGSLALQTQTATPLTLATNNTERARIDTNGNLLMGTTSLPRGATVNNLQVQSSSQGQIVMRNSGQAAGRYWFMGVESSNDVFIIYPDTSGGVYMTRGATSWTGNSDERLKTDLKPIENAAEKITQLRTVTGRFKTDEENVSRAFLIAQDVQTVLPEAVDAKDDELGTLGIRYTDTIPLLVAAIKEQQAMINEMKAEIAALKGAAQ